MIEIIPNFHPVVVHFPIVLTMVAFALALLSNLLKSHRLASYWSAASHLALWAAALSALMAVVFGWLAYNSVNHDDAGHAAMGIHRVWAVSTAGLLLALAFWDIKKHLLTTIFPLYFVVLLGVASASVGATAWLGGEVVFRHGIGVLSLPEPEDEGVTYDHDAYEHDAAATGHDDMKMDMPIPTKSDAQGKLPVDKTLDSSPAIAPPPTAEIEKQAEPTTHHADEGHTNDENSGHDHHKHQHAGNSN